MADLKQLARRIFNETLSAIDIPATMQRKLRRKGALLYCVAPERAGATQNGEALADLRTFARVRVIAIGKAAHAMVDGLTAAFSSDGAPDVAFEGIVSAPAAPVRAMHGMKYFVAGHPVPTAESWNAAQAILELLKSCDERTLVFFLLSGGGSALAELPLDPRMTLEDVQQLNRALVACGAPIDAINTVRKHVSAVKGGRLAAAAGRATKITLAVSDVPAGQETALASGPTLPDPTSVADVKRIVAEYSLREKFPEALRRWLDEGKMPETPKEGDAAFAKAHFSLLLGMDDLFHPAHHAAEAKGFMARCDNTTDDWPVEKAADCLLGQLEEWKATNPGRRVALIADGEVSSPVTGDGIGRAEFGVRAGLRGENCRTAHCRAQRGHGRN
jgi:glycerate 2-kinase